MKKALVLMALIATMTCHAELYKCKDASGNIKYQGTKCQQGESQALIKPAKENPKNKKSNHKHTIMQNSKHIISREMAKDNHQSVYASAAIEKQKKQKKKRCKNLRRQLRAAENKIKSECESRRDTYCNNSPALIEKIFIARTYGYSRGGKKGHKILLDTRTASIFKIQTKLKENKC